jgi:hypothetical protein
MNVQVVCTLSGNLAWISDPAYGSRHDTWCLRESGALLTFSLGSFIGDKGYIGNDMITPIRKDPGRDLLNWEKEFNKQVGQIRWVIFIYSWRAGSARSEADRLPGGSVAGTTWRASASRLPARRRNR